jgi:nucleotide-binding universal stress UspA family protein
MPKSIDAIDEAERRGSQQTHSMESVLSHTADAQRTMFSQSARAAYDTIGALFQLQPASLEASLRLIEVAGETNRHVLEVWLSTTQQTQRTMLEVWGLWSGQAERLLETSEQTTERLTDRITGEAEHVAKDAQAAADQHETRRERQEHEAREPQAINVVKREDDWAVVRDHASRATGVFDTKREAVERARELAKRDNAEVHIGTVAEGERAREQGSGGEQKPAEERQGTRT